jgi:hypothetical protein
VEALFFFKKEREYNRLDHFQSLQTLATNSSLLVFKTALFSNIWAKFDLFLSQNRLLIPLSFSLCFLSHQAQPNTLA